MMIQIFSFKEKHNRTRLNETRANYDTEKRSVKPEISLMCD